MATRPTLIRQAATANVRSSIGTATTPDGSRQVVTTKVTNSIEGDKELQVTFAVAGGADVTDVTMLSGAWRTAAEKAVKTGVTFSSPGFASFESFQNYFGAISTNIASIRIETDNVDNFMSALKFTEKDPTGQEKNVTKTLSKYRVPVGNGYSEVLEIDEADMDVIKWEALEMAISRIKATSEVTFYFRVRGWNKAQDLSPLSPDII